MCRTRKEPDTAITSNNAYGSNVQRNYKVSRYTHRQLSIELDDDKVIL